MKRTFILCLVVLLLNTSFAQFKKWKLIWSDEFNYNGLPDSAKWSFETRGNANGWGNNEKQFYTDASPANVRVSKGTLKIIARKETAGNKEYTSARLSSAGKAEFQYGKIEARMKLPSEAGVACVLDAGPKQENNTVARLR